MNPTLLTPHPDPSEVVDDVRRREFLGLLAAVGVLAACGTGDDASDTSVETRSFEHAGGVSEVPVAPTRIVSLGSTYVTWQLATLGVLSIGTSAAPLDDPAAYIRLVDPEAADALDGLVSVGNGEVDLEEVARLRPDLIIGGDFQLDLYDQLSAIAPTVLLATDLPSDRYFGVQAALADLTGTTDVLEARHAAYDERVAALKARHGDRWADLAWLVLDDYATDGGDFLVNLTPSSPGHRVLRDLGAVLAPAGQEYATGEDYVELSPELVTGLDADVMFVCPPYDSLVADPDAPITPELERLLTASAASAAGQVLPVGLAWTNTNVASLETVLDDLERFIGERTDGFFDTSFTTPSA